MLRKTLRLLALLGFMVLSGAPATECIEVGGIPQDYEAPAVTVEEAKGAVHNEEERRKAKASAAEHIASLRKQNEEMARMASQYQKLAEETPDLGEDYMQKHSSIVKSIRDNEKLIGQLKRRHKVTEKDILAASHQDLTSVSTEIEYPDGFRKADLKEVERMFSEYGKPSIMNYIRKKRGNRITIEVKGKLKETMGPPAPQFVTPKTILVDLNKLGLTLKAFEEALLQKGD